MTEVLQKKLVLGLLALCLILLVIILILHTVQHRRQKQRIQLLREEQAQQEIRLRSEIITNLHQMYDSLVNTFSSVSQNYGDYLGEVLRQNDRSAQQTEQRLQHLSMLVADSLSRMEKDLKDLQNENSQKLREIRETVDEKLNTTLENRLNASFSQVSERLEQVYKSLGEVHSLAGGVTDLKRMLGNVKTRGIWGEVQLGALLQEALTDTQYRTNVQVVPGSGERVEFAVCLPGKGESDEPVLLPIDSKFPQEDYLRLVNASRDGEAAAVSEAQKALMNSVRTEAKRIGKYIAPPWSTDFAIMFLPLESLYAEVVSHADAVEGIRREQHVVIAGPSTLLAMLNSLQMGFRTLAIEKRSAEVWRLLGEVKGDFHTYSALLQKTQEKLRQASESVDTAFHRTRTMERRLHGVESVDGEKGEGTEQFRLRQEYQNDDAE